MYNFSVASTDNFSGKQCIFIAAVLPPVGTTISTPYSYRHIYVGNPLSCNLDASLQVSGPLSHFSLYPLEKSSPACFHVNTVRHLAFEWAKSFWWFHAGPPSMKEGFQERSSHNYKLYTPSLRLRDAKDFLFLDPIKEIGVGAIV